MFRKLLRDRVFGVFTKSFIFHVFSIDRLTYRGVYLFVYDTDIANDEIEKM